MIQIIHKLLKSVNTKLPTNKQTSVSESVTSKITTSKPNRLYSERSEHPSPNYYPPENVHVHDFRLPNTVVTLN